MNDWPISSDEDAQGRIGVHIVGVTVTKRLGWIFRETSSSDLGIDGEIEIRQHDKTSHGRVISVQIKSGKSYLREQTTRGYVYRGSFSHLRYWTEHTTPVIVVLCDPETESCWWQSVDFQKVSFHEKGWSMEIPFENELSETAAQPLQAIAARLQKKDLVELLFRDWLGWSFEHRIVFATWYAIPRDYHWFSLLARVEEGARRSDYMIDYLLSDLDGFDNSEILEMHHWAEYNHRFFGYDRLLLGFISEIPHLLNTIPDPIPTTGITVEYVPLLLDLNREPKLSEVAKGGQLIECYEQGYFLDGGAAEVERNIRRS